MFSENKGSSKIISVILMFCTCTHSPLEIPFKGFVFSRAASLQPITLLKSELLHECFSQLLDTSAENLLKNRSLWLLSHERSKKWSHWMFLSGYFRRRENNRYISCSIQVYITRKPSGLKLILYESINIYVHKV